MVDPVDREAADHDRPFFAENRKRAFEVLRPGGGGCLDDTQSAVGEFQRRDRRVLGLDVRKAGPRRRKDPGHRAHEPFEKIDMMARLVGEHAAI